MHKGKIICLNGVSSSGKRQNNIKIAKLRIAERAFQKGERLYDDKGT